MSLILRLETFPPSVHIPLCSHRILFHSAKLARHQSKTIVFPTAETRITIKRGTSEIAPAAIRFGQPCKPLHSHRTFLSLEALGTSDCASSYVCIRMCRILAANDVAYSRSSDLRRRPLIYIYIFISNGSLSESKVADASK